MSGHSIPVRVYYEDTDAGGVVFYANYLSFLERCRTEWLRHLGFDQRLLAQDPGVLFVVARVEIDYKSPARFDDLLTVTAAIAERSRATLTFAQQVLRGTELVVEARVRVACVDTVSFKPIALPADVADALIASAPPSSSSGAQR